MLITGISKKGGMESNQDAYGNASADGAMIAVTAGGSEAASREAVDAIIRSFKASPMCSVPALEEYIRAAKKAVTEKALSDPKLIHIAVSVTVLVRKGSKAVWANIGSGRLYMFSDGSISEVTEDDTEAFDDFMSGKIEYDDIRRSEGRHNLKSSLCVQMGDAVAAGTARVNSRTSFLICTDGFWERIGEEQMEDALKASGSTHEWLNKMLEIAEIAPITEKADSYAAVAIMI